MLNNDKNTDNNANIEVAHSNNNNKLKKQYCAFISPITIEIALSSSSEKIPSSYRLTGLPAYDEEYTVLQSSNNTVLVFYTGAHIADLHTTNNLYLYITETR